MLVETDDEALQVLLQNKVTKNDAFRLILKKYQQKIYYFLRRMGLGHEDADELLQDVFVKFWKTVNTSQAGEALNITLYGLAAKGCLAYQQKHSIKTLQGLTAEKQLFIILKEQEEFDFQEIAQITAIPVNEVRVSFTTGTSEIYHQKILKTNRIK